MEKKEIEFHVFTDQHVIHNDRDDDLPMVVHHVGSRIDEKIKKMKRILRETVGAKERCLIYIGDEFSQETHLLAHLSMQYFPDRARFVSERNEEMPYMQEFPLHERMATFRFYHHIHEFLESGNYLSAKRMISNHFQHKDIDKLLDFGNGLFSLELENKTYPDTDMFELLIDTLREIDGDEEEIRYVERMKKLRKGSQKEFIFFIHNYASFLYEQEDLIDFVVLYYRLVEESLLYALGWDYVENVGSENGYRFVEQTGKRFVLPLNPHEMSRYFHHYLRALKKEIRKIENEYTGVSLLNGNVTALDQLNERDRYFADIYHAFQDEELIDFLDLRHEGVSGHGFADFTVEDFERICGGKPPLVKIKPTLEKLGLVPEFSLFDLVQKAVLALLKEDYDW